VSANAGAAGLPAAQLETPALCLDLDAYRRNLRRLADSISAPMVSPGART